MTEFEVTEGNRYELDYLLENRGDETTTEDVELRVDGEVVDSDASITLAPGEETTGTLVTDAFGEDDVDETFNIELLGENTRQREVFVVADIPDIPVAYGGDDENTYVHDVSDGSLFQTLTESGDDVQGVALSDTHVVYGGFDDNTYVHDFPDGSLVQTLTDSGENVRGVALSDTHVAYASRDENTYVHDVSDGSLVHTLTESGDRVFGVALSDSHVAYGGIDDNTYVHDVSDGSLVQTLTESGNVVNSVALL